MTWIPRDRLEIEGTRHEGALLDAEWRRMIEFGGLEIPLLAFPEAPHRVMVGARRARAVRAMRNYDDIPVYVAPTAHAMDAWLVADKTLAGDHLFGPGRPWTWVERGRLLGQALEAYRETRTSAVHPLAHYFDVHEVQLRHALYLVRWQIEASPEQREKATQAIALMESGELKPQSAYRRMRDGAPLRGRRTVVAERTPGAPPREQVKVLRGTKAALAGMLHGLHALGDLSPEITDAERLELAPTFAEARALFTRLVRQLQVDTNKGE